MAVIIIALATSNIQLVTKIKETVQFIFADPYMFQTILRNLIINAIKFTQEGGNVNLLLERDDEHEQIFSVSDDGIGMNEEILNSIFQIDTKINRIGTNGEPSSGLGLLLCKEFVEKHGGKIWAESKEGEGSKFIFSLTKSISSLP